MRWVVVFGLMVVLVSSGCTVQDPGDEQGAGNESRAVSQALPSGPGWFCGSLKVNGSIIKGRTGMVVDALEQAGLSFMAMVIDPEHPEQYDSCNRITSSGILCMPSQSAGSTEGEIIAVGMHGEMDKGQDLEGMIEQASCT